PIHPMSPFSKITWLEHDHPEIARETKKYIGIKEFVFQRLFGEYVVDHSIASATGLMNLEKLEWEDSALDVAGSNADSLSRLVSTQEICTGCASEYCKEMGISPKTKFVIGASEGVLSNIGVNAFRKGDIAVTIGTSGAIRTVIPKPHTDPKGRIFCSALTEADGGIDGSVGTGGWPD